MSQVFGLTSPWLLILLGVLLVAVLVWAIGWLPRHRASTGWAMLHQSLALVLSVSLSVLLIGLSLNRSNGWYTSWSDIIGVTATSGVTHYTRGAKEAAVKPAPIDVGHATALQADPTKNAALTGYDPRATGGQYLTVTIPGDASGIIESALVWLPPSYQANPHRFYPVLLGFSGYPVSPESFRDELSIGTTMKTLEDDRLIRDAIVVMPRIFPGSNDGECVDGTTGPNPVKWETYVDTDVRNWVKTNLRAVPTPDAWATVGYSAGGFCAAMFPVRHPDHYQHGIVMSGYFAPEWSRGQQYRPAGDKTYDLATVVKQKRPRVSLFAYAARDDQASMGPIAAFTRAVRSPTKLTTVTQATGGHNWAVWLQGLPAGLEWLGATSPQFAWHAS